MEATGGPNHTTGAEIASRAGEKQSALGSHWVRPPGVT